MPRNLYLSLAALAAIATVSGCASVPKPLTGAFADSEPANRLPVQTQVRWGGRIVETRPQADRTCIEVLALPLDANARPRQTDDSGGRFTACRRGFYDPMIFARDREITVTGRISGEAAQTVGDFRYAMPEVAADTIFLWPERKPADPRLLDPWQPGPWGSPWGWRPGWRW